MPPSFNMKEIRTDLEKGIMASLDMEMGNVKLKLCTWHMSQAISRKLNSKGQNGFRVLNEMVMRKQMFNLYSIIKTLPVIPMLKKKQNLLLHQMIDRERIKIKKKVGKTTVLYLELARFLEYLELTYLDFYNSSYNPKFWATEDISIAEGAVVTSINESVNSNLKKFVKKNASEINQVRGLQQTQLRYIINNEYRQYNTNKKRKKRCVVVRNVLYREIHKKIQNLDLNALDGTLDEKNAKQYKSLVKSLCKVQRLALNIVKRDEDGSDFNFQCWIKSHLDSCPEDNSTLKSYLRADDSIPLIPIDQLLQSLEEKTVEKKVVKSVSNDKSNTSNFTKKSVSDSPTNAPPKAKKKKLTGIVMDSHVSSKVHTPQSKCLSDSRLNDKSPKLNTTGDIAGTSLTKRRLHFTGKTYVLVHK